MRFITFCIVLLTLNSTVLAQTSATPNEKTCLFSGRVADTVGISITKAFVLLYDEGDEKSNQQLVLNKNGEFQLKLEPGMYDLFVASPGFIPVAKVIDLRSCKPENLILKMQVDSVHMED